MTGVLGLLALLGCVGAGSDIRDQAAPGEPDRTGERLFVAPPLESCDPDAPPLERARIASWNIFGARAASLDELAAELARTEADVLVLQEVSVFVPPGEDQARELAARLGYSYAFAAAVADARGAYGQAVLSRLPFAAARRIALESVAASQPRAVLATEICFGPHPVRVVDVHLDYFPEGTEQNTVTLLDALEHAMGTGVLLVGDFNAEPGSPSIQRVHEAGAHDVVAAFDDAPTWEDRRIDYVFADGLLAGAVLDARVVQTDKSDHHLVVVDFAGDFMDRARSAGSSGGSRRARAAPRP
jgi:endonuclease/exonuclease/phosphatase family metal-dependent hydrolase